MNYTAAQKRLLNESDFEKRKKERELRASGYDRSEEMDRLQQREESNTFLHLPVAETLSTNTSSLPYPHTNRISVRAYIGLTDLGNPTFGELFYMSKESLYKKSKNIGIVTIKELESKIREYVDGLEEANPREVMLAERWINSSWKDFSGMERNTHRETWVPRVRKTDIDRIIDIRRTKGTESFLDQNMLKTLSDPISGPGLSRRAQVSLRGLNNPSFREFFVMPKEEILKERNTGIKTVREFENKIKTYVNTLDRIDPEELDLAVEWVRSHWVGATTGPDYLGPGWVPKLIKFGIIK